MHKSVNSFSNNTSYKCVFIGVILVLIHQTYQTLMPNGIASAISILAVVFCSLGCFTYFTRHNLSGYTRWFLFLIMYFTAIGILYGSLFSKEYLATAINQDFRYVFLFLSGGIFADSYANMLSYHKIMKIVGYISIGLGVFAVANFDMSIESLSIRTGGWSLNYFMWWASSSCFMYLGNYALYMKKDRILGFSVVFVYFLLGLLFLKRSSILTVAIMAMIYLLFKSGKRFKSIFNIGLICILAIGMIFAFFPGVANTMFELLFSRFREIGNIGEFDRVIESLAYYQEASIFQIIFGNGIGHYHLLSNPLFSERGILNSLHLGYNDVVYKGGVFYAIFYISIFFNLLGKARRRNLINFDRMCIATSLTFLATFFYEGSWTYTVLPFCVSAPLFYIVNKQ